RVSTESQLQDAVRTIQSHTTIVIAAGTYQLTSTLSINGSVTDVTLRGETDNRDDVVLVGAGMNHASYGRVPYGIVTGGSVQDVAIANLTIRDIYYRAVVLMPGTLRPHLYNVHFLDSGEQFIEGRANDDGTGGVAGAIVE